MATTTSNTVAADILVNFLGDFSLSIYLLPICSLAYRIQMLTRYYGLATSIVLNVLVRNLWCVEAEILSSNDDKLSTSFRQAHQSECNMTAVTVRVEACSNDIELLKNSFSLMLIMQSALVASVSTAALALPDLNQTWWPAEALFIASLVFSLISVFTASKQQKITGRLLQPQSLRRYIRVRKDVVAGFTHTKKKKTNQSWGAYISEEVTDDDPGELENSLCVYLPSPVSCLMFSAPRLLLAASVLSFIIGVGIYTGTLAFTDLGDSHTRHKNVFIVYCVTAAFGFSLYIQSSLVQWSQKVSDEGDKIMEDLNKRRQHILNMLRLRSNTDYLQYQNTLSNYPAIPTPRIAADQYK